MRHKRSNAKLMALMIAMLILVGFFAARALMGPPQAPKEQVTLISTSNFDFSDLMTLSDP